MAVEIFVRSKHLAAEVEKLYAAASAQGLGNGDWALLGQVYATSNLKETRVKLVLMPKPWPTRIQEVVTDMERSEARKAKRKPRRSNQDGVAK